MRVARALRGHLDLVGPERLPQLGRHQPVGVRAKAGAVDPNLLAHELPLIAHRSVPLHRRLDPGAGEPSRPGPGLARSVGRHSYGDRGLTTVTRAVWRPGHHVRRISAYRMARSTT